MNMFATLRQRNDSFLVERASSNATFSACNYCRSKKVRYFAVLRLQAL